MNHGGGLQNFGATCALNTLVQILTYSTTIRTILFENVKDGGLTTQLVDVVDKLYNKRNQVAPGALVHLMYTMFPGNFKPHEQMDICEVWMLLSQKIVDELAVPVDGSETFEALFTHALSNTVQGCLNSFNNNSKSAFLQAIQGVHFSTVKCDCGETQCNVEVQTTYEIEVPSSDQVHSVSELLLRNYALDRLNDWTCEKCTRSGALKQNQMYVLPKILMVCIKRFGMDAVGTFVKINTPVHVDEGLLFKINGASRRYSLTGVANHYGGYNGGHYNAHVRVDDDAWVCFDDMNVFPLPNTEFLRSSQSAYLMCYELEYH